MYMQQGGPSPPATWWWGWSIFFFFHLFQHYRFVCVEVLRPCQPNGVMSSAVSLPNHTFTGFSPLSGSPVLCTFFRQKLTTANIIGYIQMMKGVNESLCAIKCHTIMSWMGLVVGLGCRNSWSQVSLPLIDWTILILDSDCTNFRLSWCMVSSAERFKYDEPH